MNYGFMIRGNTAQPRKLIDHQKAFAACCAAEAGGGEAYLSAFSFTQDFADYMRQQNSTKGYAGPCGSGWLWLDIDRDDLRDAQDAARRIVGFATATFAVADDALLMFFSGSKGFHIGVPLQGFSPPPTADFHQIARALAEQIAAQAGVEIDAGVYDRVRAFRSPNSRHGKTGLYKVRLTHDELMQLSPDGVLTLARTVQPFDLSELAAPDCGFELPAAWNTARQAVEDRQEAARERKTAIANGEKHPKLNPATMQFIREGADNGDRHRLLFSGAADLTEVGAAPALVESLLWDAARDSGLPPNEIKRQIDCGIKHAHKGDSG